MSTSPQGEAGEHSFDDIMLVCMCGIGLMEYMQKPEPCTGIQSLVPRLMFQRAMDELVPTEYLPLFEGCTHSRKRHRLPKTSP